MGSDEGGRERGDEGGATKGGASIDMPRDASVGHVSGLVINQLIISNISGAEGRSTREGNRSPAAAQRCAGFRLDRVKEFI